MENSISDIKLFNTLVNDFFNELIEIFPQNINIKIRQLMFEGLIKINVKQPCIRFMNGVVPYLNQIASKDILFLTGEHTHNFIKNLSIDKTSIINLSEHNIKAIWSYIILFIKVGINIVQMPEESHAVIEYIINNN